MASLHVSGDTKSAGNDQTMPNKPVYSPKAYIKEHPKTKIQAGLCSAELHSRFLYLYLVPTMFADELNFV
jgi:hypothetical protein